MNQSLKKKWEIEEGSKEMTCMKNIFVANNKNVQSVETIYVELKY
jgi:hypothetical protein